MAGLDEGTALAVSLGEHTVDSIGRDHLLGLHLSLNTRACEAHIIVALKDNTDDEQRRAIEKLIEVEESFAEDATVSFVFATEIPADVLASSKAAYSYA